MNRKSDLDAAFGSASHHGRSSAVEGEPQGQHIQTPAARAMNEAFRGLAAQADSAAALLSSDAVVELDTALIDGSIIQDRITDASDTSLNQLIESMRISGQQVPILVRPHPTNAGRFQIAYGRRRLAAARAISLPIRAVIRHLTDEELVVAQGKENLERRNLSYIERAFFAKQMEDHGFRREVITEAMGVLKSELSTLISIARKVPENILSAIGPAPSAGRPRWSLLMDQLKTVNNGTLTPLFEDPAFRAKSSDNRFAAVLAAVSVPSGAKSKGEPWVDPEGRTVARITRGRNAVGVTFDDAIEPGFADYVMSQLSEMLVKYKIGAERGTPRPT